MVWAVAKEEIGWRGFALDRLLSRHNDLVASLILGVVWALWHLPLWFMTGTSQGSMPFGSFLLMSVALSIIMTWVYVDSGGSMFLAMWTHGVANAYMAIFPVLVLAPVDHAPVGRSMSRLSKSDTALGLFGATRRLQLRSRDKCSLMTKVTPSVPIRE